MYTKGNLISGVLILAPISKDCCQITLLSIISFVNSALESNLAPALGDFEPK